ncbi:MAG TPA: GntR family transcriptional regulator [Arachidicoccus sp.]|nr:GntR family transcriptional regulator [Arachidicoccus sp.]
MTKSNEIAINSELKVPYYKQIMESIYELMESEKLSVGDLLPSMNELSKNLNISRETVKKAYNLLREENVIEASQGKGFYLAPKKKNKIKILLLFDKLSTYKQVLFNSFAASMRNTSELTIRLHNQDIELFEHFVKVNLNKFDYYLITPHFPLDAETQARLIKVLRKIPNRKLILLDRNIEELPGNYGAIYQDFEKDIYEGLHQAHDLLKKYKTLNVISMKGSLYAPLIEKGVERFCKEKHIKYNFYKTINVNRIQKQESFLILNSQLDTELIELIRAARLRNLKVGEDIGILSYNESPVNEIILNGLTVLSTDFVQMGELASKMIMDNALDKVKCDFKLLIRNTF